MTLIVLIRKWRKEMIIIIKSLKEMLAVRLEEFLWAKNVMNSLIKIISAELGAGSGRYLNTCLTLSK